MYEFWQHSRSSTLSWWTWQVNMWASTRARNRSRTSNEFKIEFNEIPANKIKHVSNIFVLVDIFWYESRDFIFRSIFCCYLKKMTICWTYFSWWDNLLFLSSIFSIQVFLNWNWFSSYWKKNPTIRITHRAFVYFSKKWRLISSNLIALDMKSTFCNCKSYTRIFSYLNQTV